MNYKLISFLYLNLLAASSLFSQSCLIADFPFNGNANDISGNGNNGTVTGAILTTGHDGTANSAYFFDAIDDVIVTNNTLGNFGTGEFSISCWMKTTLQTTIAARFISKRATCQNVNLMAIGVGDGTIMFECNNGTTTQFGNGSFILNDGNWHHITVVRKGILYAIYVDGKLDIAVTTPSVFNSDNNAPMKFAQDPCDGVGSTPKFTGSLDDIRIYDCALNVVEIAMLVSDSIHCTVYDTVPVAVTDTLIINAVLSVNPFSSSRIIVYPNPSNNLLIIENSNYLQMTNYSVKILNSIGQQIFISPFNVPTMTVDLNQFGATGLYFLQVLDPGSQIIEEKKIVLN